VKIATWNVNSIRVRLPHIIDWLSKQQPDILCLQETKVIDELFPAEALQEVGYESIYCGQKTYNGVATLSKSTAEDVLRQPVALQDEQKRCIVATIDNVRVINVYVPNGSEVGSDKYQYKLQWLRQLHAYLKQELELYEQLVVVGDYNIAPEDSDVHDPEAWQGSVLVSDKERDAFQAMLAMGLVDVFRQFEQEEGSYSWWDYRAAAFRRNRGLRIDHILCSEALSQQCHSCIIDKEPRSWEKPSDHAPVVAEFK
jgi:exodeoxyribonuclease III